MADELKPDDINQTEGGAVKDKTIKEKIVVVLKEISDFIMDRIVLAIEDGVSDFLESRKKERNKKKTDG